MNKGVVHYSTDSVFLRTGGLQQEIAYSDLERSLPHALVERVESHDVTTIIAINGPGGFTALRIGSLALQTLKQFHEKGIALYSLSKIQLYELAVRDGLLPAQGVIGIGQKKKMWVYDRMSTGGTHSLVSADTIQGVLKEQYFVDQMNEHLLLEMFIPGSMVQISSTKRGLLLSYQEKDREITYEMMMDQGPVEQVEPTYMIEPTLS